MERVPDAIPNPASGEGCHGTTDPDPRNSQVHGLPLVEVVPSNAISEPFKRGPERAAA
jgi:hypothetical protein